ncbi:MAG: zinc ribbon domain-containing protein [Spirochaetia bacterium]|nr:zinc ribbon domain-containing protein [Spirochaetia bacterium]
MPTYSYQCADCGHVYDAFQSMKDEPHTECPECKGKVERLIGAGSGILFKGSGFYVTDYKSSSGSASTKTDSKKGSSGASGN